MAIWKKLVPKKFSKKNFFDEIRNFLDSGVIFLGKNNQKTAWNYLILPIMNQLSNIQSIT